MINEIVQNLKLYGIIIVNHCDICENVSEMTYLKKLFESNQSGQMCNMEKLMQFVTLST